MILFKLKNIGLKAIIDMNDRQTFKFIDSGAVRIFLLQMMGISSIDKNIV